MLYVCFSRAHCTVQGIINVSRQKYLNNHSVVCNDIYTHSQPCRGWLLMTFTLTFCLMPHWHLWFWVTLVSNKTVGGITMKLHSRTSLNIKLQSKKILHTGQFLFRYFGYILIQKFRLKGMLNSISIIRMLLY